MAIQAKQVQQVSKGEVRILSAGFITPLSTGELLTGTPTVVEMGSSDLTISNVAVSTGTLTIDSVSHTSGQAVQCKVIGQAVATTYKVRVTAATDATVAQTFVLDCLFSVEAST